VLNARRPLIRPGSLSEKSLAFICTKDGFFEQATPAAELCSSSKLDFTTQFCFFEDLKKNLQHGFEVKSDLHLCAVSLPNYSCGVWVFKRQYLHAYLPIGIPASALLSNLSLPLEVTLQDLLRLFLIDYVRILRLEKTRFELTSLDPDEVYTAALLRSLSDNHLIYGEAESREKIKVLKQFNFLTHDLPPSNVITLRQLSKQFNSILNGTDFKELLNPKQFTFLEHFKMQY
jgi:hypothetical protein